jgi:hypothetical protein
MMGRCWGLAAGACIALAMSATPSEAQQVSVGVSVLTTNLQVGVDVGRPRVYVDGYYGPYRRGRLNRGRPYYRRWSQWEREYRQDLRRAQREYQRELREARRGYQRELREARRGWRR